MTFPEYRLLPFQIRETGDKVLALAAAAHHAQQAKCRADAVSPSVSIAADVVLGEVYSDIERAHAVMGGDSATWLIQFGVPEHAVVNGAGSYTKPLSIRAWPTIGAAPALSPDADGAVSG